MRRPLLLSAGLLISCATSPYDRAWLAREIARQTGHPVRAEADAASTASRLPPGVSLGDGVTEEEAAATALWNNPTLQADLTQLGFSRGDLADAGLLPNPTLSLLFPLGARQIEAWLAWPIEVLWQRPRRVEAARLDVERVARGLVQNGLDVARDARLAHAEVALASARTRIRAENARTLASIAELTAARLRAGDVGEPEAAATRVEAGVAAEQNSRAEADAVVARARLAQVLGIVDMPDDLAAVAPAEEAAELPDVRQLVATALAARPDVRAAEIAVEAAGARAGWERSRIFAVTLRTDVFAPPPGGEYTGRIGPQITLPIFNQNQGGVGRAEAEAERAAWRVAALRQQVTTEVAVARAQFTQARAALGPWRADVLPAAEGAVRGATQAFEQGETSYLAVLDATRRLLDVRLREAELHADLRRARAQLDRSTGGRRDPR